jgi:predicted homoserine dehydrogenase-like protein
MPAADSLALGGLPIGLAHGVKLVKPVAAGRPVTWGDVEAQDSEAVRCRGEMETRFARNPGRTGYSD